MFEAKVYRRKDIHQAYGGQAQSGISTPSGSNVVLLFTGSQGHRHGYSDGWLEDRSTFLYSGEGQLGDMLMQRGNVAIRDHVISGKKLYLFEYVDRGMVQFVDEMVCIGFYWELRPDTAGDERRAIVFMLRPASVTGSLQPCAGDAGLVETPSQELAELRQRATSATAEVRTIQERTQRYIERSRAVRAYALARAGGVCEHCGKPAPFVTQAGRPYLEVHHILKLADEGPDDPEHVAALCPNCHRMAHHSVDKTSVRATLLSRIAAIEQA